MAAWIEYVKDYAQKNNTTYGNALRDENCKNSWKARKGMSTETKFKNGVLDELKKSEIKKKDILMNMEGIWETEVKNKKESRKKAKSLTKSSKKSKISSKSKTLKSKQQSKNMIDHFIGTKKSI
jgi:hypothetical protein